MVMYHNSIGSDNIYSDSLIADSQFYLCTELLSTELYLFDKYSLLGGNIIKTVFIDSDGDREYQDAIKASIRKKYKWDHNDITIKFLDGELEFQRKVYEIAKVWENHCGIRFIHKKTLSSDIKISFDNDRLESRIGKECKNANISMKLGGLKKVRSEKEFYRIVLHEFGHALGLIHEHQNPKGGIVWNEKEVFSYYKNQWDKAEIKSNILDKYKENQCNSTEYDSLSIMTYDIPSQLLRSGIPSPRNYVISEKDIHLISKIYPQR